MSDHEYVLAAINPPRLFNVYPSKPSDDEWARANEYAQRYDPPFWYESMTYDAFLEAERSFYLDSPERAITEDEWTYALEVLPPMAWERLPNGNGSRFLMSEMFSGPYTEQYIERRSPDGNTYAVKMVNAFDRSTWME